MSKIYVVFGEDGEYSDWTTWPVKAFSDKAKAELFEMECEKFAKNYNEDLIKWDSAHRPPEYSYPRTEEWEKWYEAQQKFYKSSMIGSPDPQLARYGGYSTKEVELES